MASHPAIIERPSKSKANRRMPRLIANRWIIPKIENTPVVPAAAVFL
jgi:hypothetical protein